MNFISYICRKKIKAQEDMFRARVYNVMIGCPSDITEEVKVVEDVIENWNNEKG